MFRAIFSAFLFAAGGISQFVCDDGTTAGPLHVQFAHFMDTAAFRNDDTRVAFREDMCWVAIELVETFGPLTQYKMYYYNDKGPDGTYGCGYQPIQDKFLNYDENYKICDELDRFGYWSIANRPSKYSSLSDVVYYSLMSETAGWEKNERDANGVPMLRIFFITTDVATWVGSVDSENQWPYNLYDSRLHHCVDYDYPSIVEHLHPAYDGFTEPGTYFIVLSRTDLEVSDIQSVPDWYRDTFLPNYLWHAQGWSEEMSPDGYHWSQSLSLTKRAACDYWAKLHPTTTTTTTTSTTPTTTTTTSTTPTTTTSTPTTTTTTSTTPTTTTTTSTTSVVDSFCSSALESFIDFVTENNN